MSIATFLIISSGIQLPQAILLFAMTTVTSGILISELASVGFTVLSAVILCVVMEFTHRGFITPDLSWNKRTGDISDVIVFSFTFGVILLTTWLSNREIDHSFHEAELANLALKNERDNLERTVEKRTALLKEKQQNEIQQLYKFAYFGRVTASVLHDLASPLSTVSLTLERLESKESSNLVKCALRSTNTIDRFIKDARSQLNHQFTREQVYIKHEIEQVIASYAEILNEKSIKLTLVCDKDLCILGDSIRLFRLIANLVENAIEACVLKRIDRNINITCYRQGEAVEICITDTGCGIAKEDLGRIFDPFFTTKSYEKNSGIGLSICKGIVEEDLRGTILVESKVGLGSKFIISLPIT